LKKELEDCFDYIKEFLAYQVGEEANDKIFDYIKDSIKNIIVEHGQVNKDDIIIEIDYDRHDNSLDTNIKIPDFEVTYTLRSFFSPMEIEFK
jgi:septum formation topological specificity factor MinE